MTYSESVQAQAEALRHKEHVRILALECRVAPDTLEITGEIPVQIYEGASESWDGRNIRK